MKFGQLMKYSMRNIFIQTKNFIRHTQFGRETILRTLSKKSLLSISLDEYFKVLNKLFLLHANLRASEI